MRAVRLFAFRQGWITRPEAKFRPSILPPTLVEPPPLPRRSGPPPLPSSRDRAEPPVLILDVDRDLKDSPEGPELVAGGEEEIDLLQPAAPPIVDEALLALQDLEEIRKKSE